MPTRYLLCVFAVLFAVPRPASAQCADGNAEIGSLLEAANAARQLTDDWAELRTRLEWDQAQLLNAHRSANDASPRFTSGLSLHFRSRRLPGFTLCKNGGGLPTDLQNLAAALVWTFDDTQADWGFRGYLFLPATGFFHRSVNTSGTSVQDVSVEQLGYSQTLVLGEARWKDRLTLGAGYLTPLQRSAASGVPVPPSGLPTQQSGFPVLAVSVPSAHLHSLFLLGERFGGLERASLGVARLPLFDTSYDVSAFIHRIDVEQQWYLSAAGGMTLLRDETLRPRVEAEVATELGPPRLRALQVSAAVDLVQVGLRDYAPLGPVWLKLSALARGSLFNSRYLETQTGVTNAWGGHLGGELQVGTPGVSLVLGAGVGRNQPTSLSAFPAAVHRTEQWFSFGLRVAPWGLLGWKPGSRLTDLEPSRDG